MGLYDMSENNELNFNKIGEAINKVYEEGLKKQKASLVARANQGWDYVHPAVKKGLKVVAPVMAAKAMMDGDIANAAEGAMSMTPARSVAELANPKEGMGGFKDNEEGTKAKQPTMMPSHVVSDEARNLAKKYITNPK